MEAAAAAFSSIMGLSDDAFRIVVCGGIWMIWSELRGMSRLVKEHERKVRILWKERVHG